MNFDDFSIITVGRSEYRINFWFMTTSEAMDKLKNDDLSEKVDNYNYE